ncbi:hypothetical protein [Paracoccus sp. PAR01]|uniref:hypothetical protein n=1 Tax=Paracoccus sp. PAR01 TaxID=2769282 RepID=UPI00177CE7B7|nr:hypothetical protein [Paracoccus sp. PAR01]MBD9528187.1 hypothetical protein [Paracoccus sp. PAR01]
MAFDGLSRDAARAWLERVIRDELERIEQRHRVLTDNKAIGSRVKNAHQDKLMGHALRLLARDGVYALLDAAEREELLAAGIPEADLPRVDEFMQRAAGEVLSDAVRAKILRGAGEAAGLERLDHHQYLDARRIYLQGRAAAYLAASKRTEPDFADALDLAERLAGGDQPLPPVAATDAPPPAVPNPEPAYDPTITAIADRLTGRKEQRGLATDKTAYQIRNTASLLVEATGVGDIRHLKQSDLARFCEVMAQLPPTYRKSAREKDMPLEDIIAAAVARGAECGLAPGTVNRNLGFVGQLLKQARSEGIEIDARLDISDLREKDDEDAQEKVKSFTREDVRSIFEGTIWRGCASELQRSVPGQPVLCDGLY